jgi:hypothetical protein
MRVAGVIAGKIVGNIIGNIIGGIVRVFVRILVRFGGGGSFGLGWVDDIGFLIGVDLRQGAEQEAADVGENGSAAGRDAVLGEKLIQVGEREVDALGGLESLPIADQGSVEVFSLLLFLLRVMPRTKTGMRVRGQEAALTSAGSEMSATDGSCGGAKGLWFHVVPRLKVGVPHPGCFCERVRNCVKTKELSFSRMQKSL